MTLLNELLDEDGEAAAQAKQMGLISKGWGRYADPKTGKITHKSDGSRLVPIDPKQQEPSGGQEPDLDKVAQDLDKSKNTGNVGMGSSPEKDRAKLANKFLKKGTADAARAKRLGDTRPHVVKNLSDKDLDKRMNKISNYMDDLKADMRGATGSYKEKYEKATKDDREAFKIYHDEFEKRRKGKVGPKPGAEPDPSALNVKGDKANKLKRAQSLRQAWKQKGNAEAQATFARDFPKQYALDVVSQQGKDLTSKMSRDMKGPKADNPQWRKDAAEQLRRHKERVAKIREMPDDTEFSDEEGMGNRRAMLDRLRGDGDDTVSGMSGKRARIVRR